VLRLALPELAAATSSSIVVGWAGAVPLVPLMLAGKEDMDESGDQEEEARPS
jgi:hypothetical protein